MAFLIELGDQLYYHSINSTRHPSIHLHYRQTSNLNALETVLQFFTTQETTGTIIYTPDIQENLQNILSTFLKASIQLSSNHSTQLIINAACVDLYPEKMASAFHHNNHEQKLWIYPLGFDLATSLLFLEPIAQTHTVTLTPIHLTQAHDAILAQSTDQNLLASFAQNVIEHFENRFFLTYNLLQSIQDLLKDQNQTLSIAESCTGGLIASKITSLAGASSILKGSIIAYHDEIKKAWIEVPQVFLQTYSYVSEVVAKSMAQGIMKLAQADYAIATTGLAGPGGANNRYPVGTVFIAVINQKGQEDIQRLYFEGSRTHIQEQVSDYALFLLLKMILGT